MTSNSYFPGLSYFHDNDLTSMLLMKSLTDVFCYLSGSVIRIIHSNPKRKKNHLNGNFRRLLLKQIKNLYFNNHIVFQTNECRKIESV